MTKFNMTNIEELVKQHGMEFVRYCEDCLEIATPTFYMNCAKPAIENGDIDLLAYLCEHVNQDGMSTLLDIAISNSKTEIVEYLITEHKAEYTDRSMQRAVQSCSVEMMDIVYTERRRMDNVYLNTYVTYMNIATEGRLDALKWCIDHKFLEDYFELEQIMEKACANGHEQFVEYFINEKIIDVKKYRNSEAIENCMIAAIKNGHNKLACDLHRAYGNNGIKVMNAIATIHGERGLNLFQWFCEHGGVANSETTGFNMEWNYNPLVASCKAGTHLITKYILKVSDEESEKPYCLGAAFIAALGAGKETCARIIMEYVWGKGKSMFDCYDVNGTTLVSLAADKIRTHFPTMVTLEEIENDDALIAYINCYNIAVSYIDSTGAGSKYHRSEIHENIDYRQINAIVSAYNLKQTLKELSVRDDTKYTTENTAILVTEPGKYRLWNRTFLVGKDNYIPIAELTTLYQIRGTNSDSDDEDE